MYTEDVLCNTVQVVVEYAKPGKTKQERGSHRKAAAGAGGQPAPAMYTCTLSLPTKYIWKSASFCSGFHLTRVSSEQH